jgi:hypothetical protein
MPTCRFIRNIVRMLCAVRQDLGSPRLIADVCENGFRPDFAASVRRISSRKGTVELPRFKTENNYNLTGVLLAMGMPWLANL